MVITAMMVWYDEPVALLRQAVRGAAVIADRIVAADGAYELVDDKRAESPPRQKRAIEETAKECGLEVTFLPPQIWAGQVAKRDAVLKEAAKGSDWVFVVDADWKIYGDREEIRAELAYLHECGYEEVTVAFFQPSNPKREGWNIWHIQETGVSRRYAFIYRAMDDMRYERNHWSLSARRPDGERIGFFGGHGVHPYEAKTGYLQARHLFEHQCLFRTSKQIDRNREFIAKRDEAMLKAGGFEL